MTISLASLLVRTTVAQVYAHAIGIAASVGLQVSSWQAGDPTRSLYHVESEMLGSGGEGSLEDLVVGWIQSRFLDEAEGDWLKVKAEQDYNVTVPEATSATCDVVLTNTSGGVYVIESDGDLIFKNTTTGKTYRNTTTGTIPAKVGSTNGTLTVEVVADEEGSDSSASAGEIDDMITPLRGVTCTNPLAAVGVDEQDASVTRAQCRAKLASLSPNGAKGAYTYVALNSELTETSNITRARAYGDSDTGTVTVYLAGPSGAVAEVDRVLVETAILTYATPLCITPSVLSASNVTVAVTFSMKLYKSSNVTVAEAEEAIEEALEQMFADRPLGGDIPTGDTTGKLYRSLIQSTIQGLYPQAFDVSVSLPVGDTSLSNGQVAALGTVTPTISIVKDPT